MVKNLGEVKKVGLLVPRVLGKNGGNGDIGRDGMTGLVHGDSRLAIFLGQL